MKIQSIDDWRLSSVDIYPPSEEPFGKPYPYVWEVPNLFTSSTSYFSAVGMTRPKRLLCDGFVATAHWEAAREFLDGLIPVLSGCWKGSDEVRHKPTLLEKGEDDEEF